MPRRFLGIHGGDTFRCRSGCGEYGASKPYAIRNARLAETVRGGIRKDEEGVHGLSGRANDGAIPTEAQGNAFWNGNGQAGASSPRFWAFSLAAGYRSGSRIWARIQAHSFVVMLKRSLRSSSARSAPNSSEPFAF